MMRSFDYHNPSANIERGEVPRSKGFYQRRGWIPVPGPAFKSQYVFNLPHGVLPEIFVAVEQRQTPIEERGKKLKQ